MGKNHIEIVQSFFCRLKTADLKIMRLISEKMERMESGFGSQEKRFMIGNFINY